MNLGLAKRHVLVTGASQGMGRSIAEAFAREGARVSLVARREEILKNVLEGIGGEKCGHGIFPTDLMPIGAPESIWEKIVAKQGPVEIVVHNLGGTLASHNNLANSEEWLRVWRLNVGIAIDLNRLIVPPMQQCGWGRIIHMVSTAADDLSGAGPYSAAKAYLKAYVQILGRQLATTGVVVSGLSPGAVAAYDNGWVKKQAERPEIVTNFLQRHQAIGRLGRGEEISPFVLLLGSELASFACASVLSVHGGCM